MPAETAASRNTRALAGRTSAFALSFAIPFALLRSLVVALGVVLALAAPCAAHLGNLSTSEIVVRGGEVDFKLISEYVPKSALKVLEIDQRHGRTEILAAVQFLRDAGF